MTIAVSAAASFVTVFTLRSSVFTPSEPTSSPRNPDATPSAADAHGVEPVASEAAGRGDLSALGVTRSGAFDVDPSIPNLSSLALELSRRAAGASLDVPCTLTVPPPVVH